MAQFRPKRRQQAPQPVATSASRGRRVSVDRVAAAGVGRGATGLVTRTISDRLRSVGWKQVQQAAVDAGRTPPSERTFRRWVQQGRVPHAEVADLIQRRDAIDRMGGTAAAAAALRRSERSIRNWRAGRTKQLRPDAQTRLTVAQARRRLTDSGINPATARPVIRFVADVHARTDGGNYDYRTSKVFEFGSGLDLEPLPRSQIDALAMALALNDTDRVTAILEEHGSTRFAVFEGYDDDTGFHFDSISNFEISWE